MSPQNLNPLRPKMRPAIRPITEGAIFPTLVRLSLPNISVMMASALAAIIELAYVGFLGTSALAGIAVVFPIVVLQQSFSNGAMGGGVSSAISRALGAKNEKKAQNLAFHALIIGAIAGTLSTGFMTYFDRPLFSLLGAHGEAMEEALSYASVIFLGSTAVWIASLLMSILRGCGNMKIPSQTLLFTLISQTLLSGIFAFGPGPLPSLGMAGIALGQVISFVGACLFLVWYLRSGRARIFLKIAHIPLQKPLFGEILRVGLLSCVSPLQTVLTVLITTAFIADFGKDALAGYGIGARLEMILVPVAFGIGVACVPMVGMAIGAEKINRARHVAAYGGISAALIVGTIGLFVTVAPNIWADLFSEDVHVLSIAYSYLVLSGPAYSFFGLGLCLLFASQGAQKVAGPVFAGTIRLIVIAIGCWFLSQTNSEPGDFFILVAAGMIIYGAFAATSVYLSNWHPSQKQKA